MTDHQIVFWTLILTAAAVVGTWLALPQIQDWLRKRQKNDGPITLGSLADAAPSPPPLAPGIVKADRQTLAVLLADFAEVDWDWLRTYSFGGSFQYSAIARVQLYVLQHNSPTDEFIDGELETLRSTLMAATLNFTKTAVANTIVISRDNYEQTRRVPDRYSTEQNDDRFLQKSDEINKAAEAVCSAYDVLVRRARLKLALAEEGDA